MLQMYHGSYSTFLTVSKVVFSVIYSTSINETETKECLISANKVDGDKNKTNEVREKEEQKKLDIYSIGFERPEYSVPLRIEARSKHTQEKEEKKRKVFKDHI